MAASVRPPLLLVKNPPPGLLRVHLVGIGGALKSGVGLNERLWEGYLYGWVALELEYSPESFQLMLGDVHLHNYDFTVDNDRGFRTVSDLGITDNCCITVLRVQTWEIQVSSYYTAVPERIEIASTATVAYLGRRVASKFGVMYREFCFTFDGHDLFDYATIKSVLTDGCLVVFESLDR